MTMPVEQRMTIVEHLLIGPEILWPDPTGILRVCKNRFSNSFEIGKFLYESAFAR